MDFGDLIVCLVSLIVFLSCLMVYLKFGIGFWGFRFCLGCFGDVLDDEMQGKTPVFLGSRWGTAALFLGAAAQG